MSSVKDRLERRILPRLVIEVSRVSWPARQAARRRRRHGLGGQLELFFAFDNPCSAIALIDLHGRLAGRDVEILLRPVVDRGIPDDPAVEQKRRYALVDARRLARRSGLGLARTEPLAARDTRFLAEWVSATPPGAARERFAVAAIRRLWLETSGPVVGEPYEALWRQELGSPPPTGGAEAVAANERLMKRRGPYDVPAAWVSGRWFFAHDRLEQIVEWLDELGWRAH
jgi:2-hydroxychromene-2-carboxylate isomerase